MVYLYLCNKTERKMTRVSQQELIDRVYVAKKMIWELSNHEQMLTAVVEFFNGVRHEQSISGRFVPYYAVKKFDATVTVRYYIKHRLQNGDFSEVMELMNDNEYFVFKGKKITTNE